MRRNFAIIMATGLVLSFTACKKTADVKPNFESAINGYYQAHPACLWSSSKQFPVQVGHDDSKVAQFDALVDQGLLVRSTSEKKIIIISKRENNYDISDKGRGAWTPDPAQPGYGNFCYGYRKVSSVDSNTPTSDQPGATTTVQYHYTFSSTPDWAKAPETQTAFPQVQANLSGVPKAAAIGLTNTSSGWQVNAPVQPVGDDSGIAN